MCMEYNGVSTASTQQISSGSLDLILPLYPFPSSAQQLTYIYLWTH